MTILHTFLCGCELPTDQTIKIKNNVVCNIHSAKKDFSKYPKGIKYLCDHCKCENTQFKNRKYKGLCKRCFRKLNTIKTNNICKSCGIEITTLKCSKFKDLCYQCKFSLKVYEKSRQIKNNLEYRTTAKIDCKFYVDICLKQAAILNQNATPCENCIKYQVKSDSLEDYVYACDPNNDLSNFIEVGI